MRRIMFAGVVLVVSLATATASAAASDTVYPTQWLKAKPARMTQYEKLVAPIQGKHGWVASTGTETPVSHINLEGQRYAVLTVCKPHDCSGQSLVSLMTPSSNTAVGALVVNQGQQAMGPKSSKITWLGQPDRPQRRFIAAYLFR